MNKYSEHSADHFTSVSYVRQQTIKDKPFIYNTTGEWYYLACADNTDKESNMNTLADLFVCKLNNEIENTKT